MKESRITYKIDFEDLKLDRSLIEKLMGFDPGNVDEAFSSVIDDIQSELSEFLDIRADGRFFEDVEFAADGTGISVNGKLLSTGTTVVREIAGTEIICLILCSAGTGITDLMKIAMESGDSFKAYTLDLYGSEIVEAAMDLVQNDLKKRMEEKGLSITNRYSPGYCEWDVAGQHSFFSLFPSNFAGISLNDSALMSPVKSVSCLVGIGKEVKFNRHTCSLCGMTNCVYRKRGV